ncbi:SRPBCC family protein [Nocardioides gilvus]|uniref:SRPBCC family protein n=1 Tax=Nocardioides gilvus TaxID=1735589 RepID=UPI000D7433CD|nr:SRPBCC family protein [Nocardioides gilvus]
MPGGAVDFTVPAEVAYDFLVDPLQRPRWQSSLRDVVVLDEKRDDDGLVRAGTRWIDVTWPGVRPRMVLTEADRPRRWVERGEWGVFDAELTLTFTPSPTGCRVAADFHVRARGVWAPLGAAASVLGRPPVLGDLRRAARILAAA